MGTRTNALLDIIRGAGKNVDNLAPTAEHLVNAELRQSAQIAKEAEEAALNRAMRNKQFDEANLARAEMDDLGPVSDHKLSPIDEAAHAESKSLVPQKAEPPVPGQVDTSFDGDTPAILDTYSHDELRNMGHIPPYGDISSFFPKSKKNASSITKTDIAPTAISDIKTQSIPEAPRQSMSDDIVDDGINSGAQDFLDNSMGLNLTPAQKAAGMSNKQKLALLTGIGGAAYLGSQMMGGSDDPKTRALTAAINNPQPVQASEQAPIEEASQVIPARKSPVPGAAPRMQEQAPVQSSVQPQEAIIPDESMNTVAGLQEAQDRKSNIELANRLGRAGEIIGTGISHAKPVAQELFNEQIKSAGSEVENFEKRAEQEKNDPKSEISQQWRDYVSKFMPNGVSPKMTANMGMKIMPYAYQKFAASDAQKARREDQAERLKAAKELKDTTLAAAKITSSGKQNEKNSDEKREFTRKLRMELQSKEYGKMLSDFNTANRSTSALESFSKNPTGYSDYGMLMSSLKTLQGDQSVVREAEIKLGKDATSLFNKVQNYIQSAATGKSLQPNQRVDMVNAIKQLRNITKDSYIRNIQPVLEQARAEGIDETVLLPESLRKSKETEHVSEPSTQSIDPKISDYAKQNELDYKRAEQILRSRGYGK